MLLLCYYYVIIMILYRLYTAFIMSVSKPHNTLTILSLKEHNTHTERIRHRLPFRVENKVLFLWDFVGSMEKKVVPLLPSF